MVKNFSRLAATKELYETHLLDILKEPFYRKIVEIFTEIKKNNSPKKAVGIFQQEMKNIRNMNNEKMREFALDVLHKSGKKYTTKVIKAAYISYAKLMIATASIKKVNVEIQIIEPIKFFKTCLIEMGKRFYLNPYTICNHQKSVGYRLDDITKSLDMIELSIKHALINELPFDIVSEIYINNIDEEEEEEEPVKSIGQIDDESDDESDDEEDNESVTSEDSIRSLDMDSDDESMPGDTAERVDEPEDDNDAMSEHSIQNSERGDEVTMNNFKEDEGITEDIKISNDEEVSSYINFVPMSSENNTDVEDNTEDSKPEPMIEREEDTKKVVFFDDAADL